ncbi:MAG: hypothetical protein AABW73_01750 [Nanoarchaeota archaeon]|mgnify:CR=1 FL=1
MVSTITQEESETYYSLTKVLEILDESGVNNAFQPFINAYLNKKLVKKKQKVKKRQFIKPDWIEGSTKKEVETRNTKILCFSKKDLEHVIKGIIGRGVAPEIRKFDRAIYTGVCEEIPTRFRSYDDDSKPGIYD